MKLLNITINDKKIKVQENLSVLQACDNFNFVVPRFCFHPFLSVAGNCRMCLVQINDLPKLQVACAILVSENMNIKTSSLAVLKSREGILELLLIFHPLDCAICDAGSECDLQDQSMFYGSDKSRFKEFKRATEDKNCSPLIKTVMTRCILCTRCVRFANEILGLNSFGSTGRGNALEIGTFVNRLIHSEFSGNLIDLCPVGALTAKSYRFLARSWELNTIDSIDVFDSANSNLRIDLRGYEVLRILPRFNEFINDVWISDKARFAFDGLNVQRLIKPALKKQNFFNNVFWIDIMNFVYDQFENRKINKKIGFYIGPFLDIESLILIKYLANKLNAKIVDSKYNDSLCLDFESNFKFNYTLKEVSNCDFCCLLGANPLKEGIILNYHIRKRFLKAPLTIGSFGSPLHFSLPYNHLGTSLYSFFDFIEGKNTFCKNLRKSNKPLIIIGKSFLNVLNGVYVDLFTSFLKKNLGIKKNCNVGVINFLCTKASDFSKYYLNLYKKQQDNRFDVMYIFGDFDLYSKKINAKTNIIQSHSGSLFIQKNSDIVLPCHSFLEKTNFFINMEGIMQKANKASTPLGQSYSDSEILFTYSYYLNILASRDNYNFVQNFIPLTTFKSYSAFPLYFYTYANQVNSFLLGSFFSSSTINNFYNTDIVSNFSMNMLKCSKYVLNKNPFIF